ncbi:glycoside hydrolase family 25 protein [Embleya sp. NPDC005971]|uniref:glycoside hydrolase family 25 protein n=1 Tax=Embleya sp. NPDC005971 TaxID=3156724 RepID=UPI00340781E7
MALAKGYDVSDYQSSIPADAEFVIVKASEGARAIQSGYRSKIATARKRGLPLGHYHFLHCEQDVTAEVAHFCDVVGDIGTDELLVCDLEPYNQGVSNARATASKNAWITAVKAAYPRNRVGLYTNLDCWHATDDFYGDFLWIADYQRAPGSPNVQAPWRFHQYSESGGLDKNVFNGTAADLRAWVSGGTAPSPPAASGPASWERLLAHVASIPEGVYEGYNARDGYDNLTRWGTQFGENGVAWCVIWDWCMYSDVGLAGLVPKVNNVSVFSDWAKARGQWSEYPSLGAWVNFGNGAHTEVVVAFTATTVTTKGGNSKRTGGDGGQGNGVWTHTYQRRDPYITGYFAPSFDTCPPTADPHDYRAGRTAPPAQEDDDMTPAQMDDLVERVAIRVLTYRNEDDDKIAQAEGERSPQVYDILGRIDANAAVAAERAEAPAPTPVTVDAAALVAAISDPSVLSALAQALAAEVAKRMES